MNDPRVEEIFSDIFKDLKADKKPEAPEPNMGINQLISNMKHNLKVKEER